MNAVEYPSVGGLQGQVVGDTSISSLGPSGTQLAYRGYEIEDLVHRASFEEVAFLLLHGELPLGSQLDNFCAELRRRRQLPAVLRELLEQLPQTVHPMEVLRTGVSLLGNLEPEDDLSEQWSSATRLLAAIPSIFVYWYRFSHDGVRVEIDQQSNSMAESILTMLHDRRPEPRHIAALNASLILYAEHELNASTFTARVCASTLSDLPSCVVAAIGSLRGSLHGGASESALAFIDQFASPKKAVAVVKKMLERGENVMGFGHAVYKRRDPRTAIIKEWARRLSKASGDRQLVPVSQAIEETVWGEKRLPANADFYHAATYRMLGIPDCLFTPIFVAARVAGWSAHILEQREHNRIIRPSARYRGPAQREFIPLSRRSAIIEEAY